MSFLARTSAPGMPVEYKTPGGLVIPGAALDAAIRQQDALSRTAYGEKSNRVQERTVTPGLTAQQAESKFKDFTSYLNAIKIPWVFPCVSVIAYNFANTPADLVNDDDEPVDNPNDPFLQLVERPNPVQSRFAFMELASMYLDLVGEVFIAMEERDGYGRPRELYLPNPARMRVVPDPENYVAGYAYEAGGFGGQFIPYAPDEIIHIKCPNPMNDYRGMGNVEASELLFNIVVAMQQHEWTYWESGGRITGVLESENRLDKDAFQNLYNMWRDFTSDRRHRMKTLILEQGLKYSPIAEGLRSLDVTGIAKGKRDEIIAVFGVPLPKLGILENAAYKMSEADEFFWGETMEPKFGRWEDGIQPLVDLFNPDRAYRFERKNFEDDTARLANATSMGETHAYTVNEIRVYNGDDPLGDDGEVIWIPNSLIPVRIDHVGEMADNIAKQAEAQDATAEAAMPGAEAGVAPGAPPDQGGQSGDAAGGGVVQLSDYLGSKGGLTPEEESAKAWMAQFEQRRQLASKSVARRMRLRGIKAVSTNQGRVRVYDQKAAKRPAPVVPMRRKAPSQRHPVIGTRIKNEQKLAIQAGLAMVPKIREAYRKQRSVVTRILPELAKLPPASTDAARAAVARAWDSKPIVTAVSAVQEQAFNRGYGVGQAMLPSKMRAAVETKHTVKLMVKADDGGDGGDGGDGVMPEATVGSVYNPYLEDAYDTLTQKIVSTTDTTVLTAIQDQVAEGVRRGYSAIQMANGVPDENYAGVAGVFDDATDWRAEMIARTESMDAYNRGSTMAYADGGVHQVEAMDGEEYDEACAERNGQIFDLDESGEVEAENADGISSEEHPNGTLAFAPVVDMTEQDYLNEDISPSPPDVAAAEE